MIRVVHYLECWLPQTMTWLYNHSALLPDDIENHLVCRWTSNLDQFPAANLNSLEIPPSRMGILRKVKRKLGMRDRDDVRHLALLEQVIQKSSPSVLHSHFGQCGWAAAGLGRKYGLFHIVSFYGLDLSYLPRVEPRWAARYQRMSDMVDLVLCEGPHMAGCLAKLGVDQRKIMVFRLGVDLDRLPFVPRVSKPDGVKRFLIAGSFREKKGIPYAMEALGLLRRRYPAMEITVIGDAGNTHRDKLEKSRIVEITKTYNLQDITHFRGYQPYEVLINEFYKHDVFVSPSVSAADGDTEGGAPVTIIEAAASGMPVASTFHCDIPFVLSEENRAYLVPERDSASLADAIERLVLCEDSTHLATANRRLIERELNVRSQVLRLADLYRGRRQ